MKRFLFILNLLLCIGAAAQAQTYTQHLQQKKQGKANVTLTQSREIETLVNGANVSARKPADDNQTPNNAHKTDNAPIKKQNNQEQAHQKHSANQHKGDSTNNAHREQHATNEHHADNHKTDNNDNEMEIPTVDMRKKVMRRAYKVNGYRVQVFAGGNSRNDKIKAQNAGNAVKMAFPSQPIYVHFYSPRWICRMGNYRTYAEANAILQQVKKMGYKQACIVSGKITVAY
ncbi:MULTISPECIES: SPOR domain-containing protein [Prevotellaceae]|uniref:SPOR domain-containing protein n=1 Tax=Leyella stercorea TaxID=363265 RepID=UPI001F2ED794|nr:MULTISPECIES: SPOR domain-containing protein [Prevotellaceae]MCF2644486.1 SPOR domain-containing protein [Leyella stercorea]MCI6130659.1 SPOR domain-containing protein [Prevotella sp.]MDD6199615.1 SPOR domain-containing protein [Prevotella sp.]MDY4643743.1 SPOR domain-containing protein [Prevotella sp.]